MIESYINAAVVWDDMLDRWEGTNLNNGGDRLTTFLYNGVDDIVQRIAHLQDGPPNTIQSTEYVYGYDVVQGSETFRSGDLIAEVRYPDESTGAPGTTAQYTVTYEYNRLGEVTETTDQNGTTHEYLHDDLGRITRDAVTTFGSVGERPRLTSGPTASSMTSTITAVLKK